MLKSFHVKNYRNFKDEVTINFADHGDYQFNDDCITNGIIGKMLIYGRNATGKSNLGAALLDASYTLLGPYFFQESSFLNADSSDSYAEFQYVMLFNENEVTYTYTKANFSLLRTEHLSINNKEVFQIDFTKNSLTIDLDAIGANETIIQSYMQELLEAPNSEEDQDRQLPFLRWLTSNVALSEDSPIQLTWNYLRRMTMLTARGIRNYPSRILTSYWEYLSKDDNLDKYEDFLNIMGVSCKLVLEKLPEGQYQLYFKHNKLVPYLQTASSGTLVLDDLYRRIISRGTKPSLMYFDEFDAHYHYEMADRLVQYLKMEYPQTQIIFTTHNTNLMTNRIMRPDCLYILSRSGNLTSLRNATQRELREGHNLEKMYISGEFEHYE